MGKGEQMTDKPRHPIQPIVTDDNGTLRFRSNAIVRYLLDAGQFDMNHLAGCIAFTSEDHEQFAQLIGYSLSGFSELGYVSDDTYAAADSMAAGETEADARIASLEATLSEVREHARALAAAVFRIHPDDLDVRDR